MEKSVTNFAPVANPYTGLQFRYPFRKYQNMVLDMVADHVKHDHKHHIVAPPGAGKTIVGLELIRRFGRPAVVFAPTTTIQRQWQEKMGLFTPDPAWLEPHTSLQASELKTVNFLTYQILSTPGENLEFVERIALDKWEDDLLSSGQAETEIDAQERIAHLRTANAKAYRSEVSKRYRRIKREILAKGESGGLPIDGRQFLHPNARDLIDRIVGLGTGVLVLDECHHLLDYWAFILRELIRELPDVQIVGLTATLPDTSNQQDYENYTSLLGEVDFEVPTPAVVKEGNLAPFRDLAYFCQPSRRERQYLHRIQDYFESAIAEVTQTPIFQQWVVETVVVRNGQSFEDFFNKEVVLCTAGVKYLLTLDYPLPDDVIVVNEMLDPLWVDDWLSLLETFALKVLKVSEEKAYQALYKRLRDVLLNFGVTITERGIRHQRSPGDLILALSEAKDEATVKILQAEMSVMGQQLRAVVMTDFERMSAKSRRLKDVLDPDAGSAVRVFRHIVADKQTSQLGAVLVTGKVVLAMANRRATLDAGIAEWVAAKSVNMTWEWEATEDERIVRLAGSGRDWASRTYVAMMTRLFEQGLTQCLVGTRGIFGEGWDAVTLNTLVDLTSVTTSTGVQQIRGRTIRLNPAWKRKVAHNWDVVCYSPSFDRGDADLRRFQAKHAHTWGIMYVSAKEEWQDPAGKLTRWFLPQDLQAPIVRGVPHVSVELAHDLQSKPFKKVEFDKVNRDMLLAVRNRDRVYDLWGVGQSYSNFTYTSTQLNPQDLKFYTAFTLRDSLRSLLWRLLTSIIFTFMIVFVNGFYTVASLADDPSLFLLAGLCLFTLACVAGIAVNIRGIWRVFKKAFLTLPTDAILYDLGKTLLASLRDIGAVSRNLSDEYVRVMETDVGGIQIFLDYASPEDSDTFARAYQEVLGPLRDARYLIERNSTSLRGLIYRPLWALVRAFTRQGTDIRAYHRVPDILASRKQRAETLASYWQKYIGGGRLIYTRSAEGRRLLLQARAQETKQISQMAFEIWR